MTFREAYERYLVELQSNGVTDNLQTNANRFVIDINKAHLKVIEWLIERKNEDDNRYLQKIKIPYKELVKKSSELDRDVFKLPADYFDFIDVRVKGSNGNCDNQDFFAREIKPENLSYILDDEFSKPSFKYRETSYFIGDDSVQIYKNQFEINSLSLLYYRYPALASLENPENPESLVSENNMEFDDKLSNRIITLAASIHSLNSNDQKYQALKAEVLSKL